MSCTQLSQVLENPFERQEMKTHSEKTIKDALEWSFQTRKKKEKKES